MVEETLAERASVAGIARAHGVNANQLFGWRRRTGSNFIIGFCSPRLPLKYRRFRSRLPSQSPSQVRFTSNCGKRRYALKGTPRRKKHLPGRYGRRRRNCPLGPRSLQVGEDRQSQRGRTRQPRMGRSRSR